MLLRSSEECLSVWSTATNIFIAGPEDQAHISSELHFLLTQNHTLKEQLNQGARGNIGSTLLKLLLDVIC